MKLNATEITWQPTCDLAALKLRAQLLARTREFFALRSVLEVETPVLAPATGTDPQLDFFETLYHQGQAQQKLFLQTSPEFAMKRLLAAGSGSIYQISKAFRNGESGRYHNPEFTLLEWYRVDFTLSELMDEVGQLFSYWFAPRYPTFKIERFSYFEIFLRHTGLDALCFDVETYSRYAIQHQLTDAIRLCEHDHSLWLDFLFSHQIQPKLGTQCLTMIHNYPACQASLARLNHEDKRVADRVEIFMNGVELGNGFFELSDATEQLQRFEQEQQHRLDHKLPATTIDFKFLSALNSGLPICSGIAIGMDRVLMLLSQSETIDSVLSFSQHRI